VIVRRRTVVAATGLALAAVLAGCGGGSDPGDAGTPRMSSGTAGGSGAAGDQASRAADVAFAQSMIPHHEQAVQMADLALENGAGDQVTRLATQIKAAQDPEIEAMRGWLKAWGADEGMAGMDHSGTGGGMPGMMSDADLRTLAAAKGAGFDQMWLTMMIAHHQGALTMANQVLATTTDPNVKTLAEAVVNGQTSEIDTMKGLLAG